VVVRRSGGVTLPVEVAFKFEGKAAERRRGTARHDPGLQFERPEKLEWVDVDPDRKILLDVNWVNNGSGSCPTTAGCGWTARWLFILQNIFTTLGLCEAAGGEVMTASIKAGLQAAVRHPRLVWLSGRGTGSGARPCVPA